LQLAGRVTLGTRASICLGSSIAEKLAVEDCRLALLARREGLSEAVADTIAGQGRKRPMLIVEDVVTDGEVDRVAKLVEGRLGHLDILINNATGSRPMPVLGTEAE